MPKKKKKRLPSSSKGKSKKVKKKAKKAGSKKSSKEDASFVGFEEVVVKCPSCGREFRMVKSSSFSTEGMLCQRCAAGGGVGFEEDSDF
jgi:hypothetical protein